MIWFVDLNGGLLIVDLLWLPVCMFSRLVSVVNGLGLIVDYCCLLGVLLIL